MVVRGRTIADLQRRISLTREVAFEALRAIAVRVRWYDARKIAVPRDLEVALRVISSAVGVDERRIRGKVQ